MFSYVSKLLKGDLWHLLDKNAGFAGHLCPEDQPVDLVTSPSGTEPCCVCSPWNRDSVEVCDDDSVVEATSAVLAWIHLASA